MLILMPYAPWHRLIIRTNNTNTSQGALMTDEAPTITQASPTSKRNGWIVPTVSTLVGVAVSILIAWYQISTSEEQALQAERERAKSVKNELIAIVEEHIINQKPLDISRLARLAEFRADQEKLMNVPSISELVENAEFNILKSQYLEYEKKQEFKKTFDSVFDELAISSSFQYTGLFENSAKDLYTSIQNGNIQESQIKLNKLLSDVNNKISELEAEVSSAPRFKLDDIVKTLFDKPFLLIASISIYAFVLILFSRYKSMRLRKIRFEEDVELNYRKEQLMRIEKMRQEYFKAKLAEQGRQAEKAEREPTMG